VALLAHPVVTQDLTHSLDARRPWRRADPPPLDRSRTARRQAGPHDRVTGFSDPVLTSGVQPLRNVRKPTDAMMHTFGVILVDPGPRLPQCVHHDAARMLEAAASEIRVGAGSTNPVGFHRSKA
jgi:hypothetical protein